MDILAPGVCHLWLLPGRNVFVGHGDSLTAGLDIGKGEGTHGSSGKPRPPSWLQVKEQWSVR